MSGILLSAVGNFKPPVVPVVPGMTIGSKTVTYSAGKIFDYYDSVVTSPGSDANITVTQDINCTIQLTGAGGATMNNCGPGGGAQALTFSFTFKTGTTYVLRLGTVANENSASGGGGYSGLFISSVSSTNAIAVVGGGGGGAFINTGATYSQQGGISGSVGPTAVTNGIGFAGASGSGTAPSFGTGGSGSAAGAGGTGGTSGSAGSGPLASTGGAGGTSGTYVGGGGGGGWYSGGGGAANSATPLAGGGGGGGTFLYTSATDPTKTATYSSSRSGSFVTGAFTNQDASGRPFVGRAGATGTNLGTSVYQQWWSALPTWGRPIPGGASGVLAVPASYDCALGADIPGGTGTTAVSLVYKVVTTAIANVGATTISIGDCRRLIGGGTTFEVAVASPYTLTASSASTTGITVSALAAAIPSGTTLYIYPVATTTAGTPGAICGSGVSGYGFSNSSISPIRIQEPAGTYLYGFAPQGTTTANFTGGVTTPVTMTLTQAIYPYTTLPKGTVVQIPKTSGDFSLALGATSMRGANPGAVRITMN